MDNKNIRVLDCTLRDGGYYNNWDFSTDLINNYLLAMAEIGVDFIEIGLRSLKNRGFKGACAFSTDSYVKELLIPDSLKNKIGVMINGSELLINPKVEVDSHGEELTHYQEGILGKLFSPKSESPISLVRVACHVHEFEACLPAATWLKNQGYMVGFNLMQITDRSDAEISRLADLSTSFPLDVLYFADSMGCLDLDRTNSIVKTFSDSTKLPLGIHAHDNMGRALANTLQAVNSGVTWVDCTVTGMGRGPGNVQTEYLVLALEEITGRKVNSTKLLELITGHFKPLQSKYKWGMNPYYYLSGRYGIHPSYIQEMLSVSHYTDKDILAVIERLRNEGGKKFNLDTLESARQFYSGEPRGTWSPKNCISGKSVLIIGAGPSVGIHKDAIERYIKINRPFVIALNTHKTIDSNLINMRTASHSVRLLADCSEHLNSLQPLATPASMLPEHVRVELEGKNILDFGLNIKANCFEFHEHYCVIPSAQVIAYTLALAASGNANEILLVGFDGFPEGDSRNKQMTDMFNLYQSSSESVRLFSLTSTSYQIPSKSIYCEYSYE